jgi:hypothetical protein
VYTASSPFIIPPCKISFSLVLKSVVCKRNLKYGFHCDHITVCIFVFKCLTSDPVSYKSFLKFSGNTVCDTDIPALFLCSGASEYIQILCSSHRILI